LIARRDLWQALTAHARASGAQLETLPPAEHRWIFTGHQVEFYHPGVWAKVIVADELARRSSAQGTPAIAFDLLVDHDLLDHRGFDVPVQADGHWSRQPVEYAPASPLPVEALQAPSRDTFDGWDAALARHSLANSDALAFFLSALRPTGEPLTHTQWLSRARARFEASMDIHVHHVPTSLLCSTESWGMFVRGWIENADAWTSLYNKHLSLYRQRQGIRNAQHPMPDLARTSEGSAGGTTYELPFWIYRAGEPRQRLSVRQEAHRRFVPVDGAEIDVTQGLAAVLERQYVLRPRALTLTMFVRMFLADLFIHGIGGALYDQITDGMLQELLGTVPPYSCVSAAWLLPLGKPIATEDDLAALKSRRHHARHNPQLAIDPFTALKTDVAERIRDRRETIEAIAASLETARHDAAARQRRRGLFEQLHRINTELHGKAPRVLANLDRQLADAQGALVQNKVLLWREWFFALHARASLEQFVSRIRRS
jgi:hypothetical protein